MKKKRILLFLVVVCMFLFLTGCAKAGPEQEMPTENMNMEATETENANTKETKAGDTVTVASLKGPT